MVTVLLYAEDRLAEDFERLCVELLIEPPNSLIDEVESGRDVLLKSPREMASSPNFAARERVEPVGVEGRELTKVLNLNTPNWWTV